MNPAETYIPTPEPSPGSILAALSAIKRDQAEILSMLRAGQVGLLALQVTAPPFVEEKPKGDDGWIEWMKKVGK